MSASNAERGRQAVRYTIPEAFKDGGGLIVEVRAFEMGPRGGAGPELRLTPAYWDGLMRKLAEKGVPS